MKRTGAIIKQAALLASVATLLAAGVVLSSAPATAQSGTAAMQPTPAPTDISAQRRRGTPLRVYRRALSPTAVRACDSWYELEHRPSGTVLVPRMRCHWVDG